MQYTHKVGLITFYENGATKANEITFVSECSEYKEAVLAMEHKRPDWHNHYLYEPVTKSPITFDITEKLVTPNGENTFNSDQFFLTCKELIDCCESEPNKENFVSFVGVAFCRTLFNSCGDLNGFFKRYLKGCKPKTYVGVDSIAVTPRSSFLKSDKNMLAFTYNLVTILHFPLNNVIYIGLLRGWSTRAN